MDKKYALPFKVVDALVFHFVQPFDENMHTSVLWHQSLLVFVQRYKEDITIEQREAIEAILKARFHESITPEIRRELRESTGERQSMMVLE